MSTFSVYHGYGFSHSNQLLVYTGTGTVYLMTEPCDTIPVWKVLRCPTVLPATGLSQPQNPKVLSILPLFLELDNVSFKLYASGFRSLLPFSLRLPSSNSSTFFKTFTSGFQSSLRSSLPRTHSFFLFSSNCLALNMLTG